MKKLNANALELCQTEDNSWTVLHRELDAHYRSTHGADSESDWVFIGGARILEQSRWRVGELGFGLGTNLRTLLRHQHTRKKEGFHSPLHYIGIDHQPIPLDVMETLLREDPDKDTLLRLLQPIHEGAQIARLETEDFTLELHATELMETILPSEWALAFFHDPFGPSTNPEAWTPEVFQKIYRWMHPSGILSTYGAAGHARRALAGAGFWVGATPGFGRKREMTVASPIRERLSHATLIRKYPPFYPNHTPIPSPTHPTLPTLPT